MAAAVQPKSPTWYEWLILIFIGLPIAAIGVAFVGALIDGYAEQKPWECRSQPGYCDIDTDWQPKH